jgi:hypothetical protein
LPSRASTASWGAAWRQQCSGSSIWQQQARCTAGQFVQ